MPAARHRRWILIAGAPLLVAVLFTLAPRRVDLWVDNGREVAIEVRVDDGTHRLEPGATLHLRLPAGVHRLAGPGGEVVADFDPSPLGPRPHYVWNVDEQARYWRAARGYGRPDPDPEAFAAPGPVFQLPADVIPALNQPLPETVRVKREQTEAVRYALWSDAYAAERAPAPLQLVVDNSEGMASFELLVDGESVGAAPPGGILPYDGLRAGEHTFTAVERGPDGSAGRRIVHEARLPPAAFRPRTFVWAPGVARPRYALIGQVYGQVENPPPNEPFEAPASWFELPADVYALNDFPERVEAAPGATGVVVRSLWTRRAYDAARLQPELNRFAEGISPVQMGELGQQIMQRQMEEAEAAERAKAEHEQEGDHEGHDHGPEAPGLEPGQLDPSTLFPPR